MGSKTDDQTAVQIPTRHLIRFSIVYLSVPLLLFLCGWDAGWWQAWVFSLLFAAAGIRGETVGGTAAPGAAGGTGTSRVRKRRGCEAVG